jgi:hypothetical protein
VEAHPGLWRITLSHEGESWRIESEAEALIGAVKVRVLAMEACLPVVTEAHPLRLTLGPPWKLMLNHHLEVTAVYPGAAVPNPGAVVAHPGAVILGINW